ncbi:hypothetical protein FVER53590_08994 [Fusarium verticillioides]|nr:hypothetical protein FVER53590_08994 [Fusarium verticillioides]
MALPQPQDLRVADEAEQIKTLDLLFEPRLASRHSPPRTRAKKVDSAQSSAEQANLQGQGEELAKLNKEYEEKFPGLRYVVFVNGRGRPEIMENMKARISRGDFSKEVDEALQAMCDIANDRASKLGVKP